MMKLFNIGTSILALLLMCCNAPQQKSSRVESLPYYMDASYTPQWISPTSDSLRMFHRIPNFQLTNQHNAIISSNTLEGKIYVADFFFATCPGICPKMTKNMKLIQDHFKKDSSVALLSHSVTPEKDSVPILAQYAIDHQITSPYWHLLTGERKQIYELGRKSYFIEEDLGLNKTDDEFLHTENFVLIDKNRHIRGIYNGLNQNAIQQLIVDIETLKKE